LYCLTDFAGLNRDGSANARVSLGDPTPADGILDRLVHNAHRIEMRGDSMRGNRGKPNT
jgi:hypothetical protein